MSHLTRSFVLLLIAESLASANAQDRAVEAKAGSPAAEQAIKTEQELAERVERLIEQLGHREYALRERGTGRVGRDWAAGV